MDVTFLHPRDSRTYQADVDAETTGQTCLDNLVKDHFIEPAPSGRPYAMVVQRNNRQILPSMSMQEADVQDNDSLAIFQQEQGAGT